MKHPIRTLTITIGFACIGQVNAAVETYTFGMNGYEVIAFVGATPAEMAQAQHLAKDWENQRRLMLKPQSMRAIAIRQSPTVALTQAGIRTAIIRAAQARWP
jgi:hypothetical protein